MVIYQVSTQVADLTKTIDSESRTPAQTTKKMPRPNHTTVRGTAPAFLQQLEKTILTVDPKEAKIQINQHKKTPGSKYTPAPRSALHLQGRIGAIIME